MSGEQTSRKADGRAWAQGSLFRCFQCQGNKHTQGRKRVFVRGVAVWICSDCMLERANRKAPA